MRSIRFLLAFYKNADSHTLLNIKNILILRPIWRTFLLLTISMQIKDINLIKALHQTLSHSPKCRIIQIAMIRNKSQNAIACLLNTPLCKANELYVIIM